MTRELTESENLTVRNLETEAAIFMSPRSLVKVELPHSVGGGGNFISGANVQY